MPLSTLRSVLSALLDRLKLQPPIDLLVMAIVVPSIVHGTIFLAPIVAKFAIGLSYILAVLYCYFAVYNAIRMLSRGRT